MRDEAGDALVEPDSDVERVLPLEPVRDPEDPDRVAEELGVREPEGAGARGGSTTREEDSPPPDDDELDEPPDEPEEPDDPDDPDEPDEPDEPDDVGRGIACAASAAGAASAIVIAATINERGNLSMSILLANSSVDRVALER